MRNVTIRKWLKWQNDTIDVFHMPETKESKYGLGEVWSKLPHGTWKMSEVPDSILDQEFYSGYGSQQVPSFLAWSKDFVYFVHEYDGSVSLRRVNRNPF